MSKMHTNNNSSTSTSTSGLSGVVDSTHSVIDNEIIEEVDFVSNLSGALYSLVLWFVPYVPTFLWLILPLSTGVLDTSVKQSQNIFLFAWVHHSLYLLIAAYFGWCLLDFVIPTMPNQFFRISVSILCAVIGAAIDTGFLWTHSDNMQLLISATVFPVFVVFLIIVILYMKTKRNLEHKTEGLLALVKRAFTLVPDKPTPGGTRDIADISLRVGVEGSPLEPPSSPSSPSSSSSAVTADGHIDSSLFYVQLIRVLMFSFMIIITYYYCEVYTYLYVEYAKGRIVKLAFSIGLLVTLLVFEVGLEFFAERIDRYMPDLVDFLLTWCCHDTLPFSNAHADIHNNREIPNHYNRFCIPLAFWIEELFYINYYRVLFTTVSDYGTFLLLQLGKLAGDIVLYPVRMTSLYYRVYCYVTVDILHHKLGLGNPTPSVTKKQIRDTLCLRFYFVAMSQRVSIIFFAVTYVFLVKGWNANYYLFKERTESIGDFEKMLYFCLYALAIEWTSSTITTVVIRRAFNLNVLSYGGVFLRKKKFMIAAIFVCIHIMQDTILAQNTYLYHVGPA